MANLESEGLRIVGEPSDWRWVDTNGMVIAEEGLYFVGDDVWARATDEFRAQFRPVQQLNGLHGLGLVKKNTFFLLLILDGK